MSSARRRNPPPHRTTLLMGRQARHPLGLIPVDPAGERIGLSRFEHFVGGDPMRGLALDHLQEGGTAISDIRFRMVIAGVLQLAPLLGTELHSPSIGLFGMHRRRMVLLKKFCSSPVCHYPIRLSKFIRTRTVVYRHCCIWLSKFIRIFVSTRTVLSLVEAITSPLGDHATARTHF